MATQTKPSESTKINTADFPYRFAVVPLDQLMIDAYQRPLSSFVRTIETDFAPELVGTLTLSKRGEDKYAVIDGQTRATGMQRRGMTEAPAVVFENLERKTEAQMFARFQTERRNITSADRFNAQRIAEEPFAVALAEVLDELDFFIAHNHAEPGAIRAVAAVEWVFRGCTTAKSAKATRDADLLKRTLKTISDAWPTLPDTAKSKDLIKGLGYYLQQHPNINMERLAERLGWVNPGKLARRAVNLRRGEGKGTAANSPKYMAHAIEAQYRTNSKAAALDDD